MWSKRCMTTGTANYNGSSSACAINKLTKSALRQYACACWAMIISCCFEGPVVVLKISKSVDIKSSITSSYTCLHANKQEQNVDKIIWTHDKYYFVHLLYSNTNSIWDNCR